VRSAGATAVVFIGHLHKQAFSYKITALKATEA